MTDTPTETCPRCEAAIKHCRAIVRIEGADNSASDSARQTALTILGVLLAEPEPGE